MRAPMGDRHSSSTGHRSGWSALATGGWIVLLAISVLGIINHALGAVAFASSSDERLMFALFALVNAYATVVLVWPYRRRATWAWAVTWIEVLAFALTFPLTGPGIGTAYLVVGCVAALAQLATLPEFRGSRRRP